MTRNIIATAARRGSGWGLVRCEISAVSDTTCVLEEMISSEEALNGFYAKHEQGEQLQPGRLPFEKSDKMERWRR